MDCHAAEAARNDDSSIAGSKSVCGSAPELETRNDAGEQIHLL